LLAPTIGFWLVCRAAGCQDAAPDLYRFAAGVARMNGYVLVFNLLPVFPLDGGRILQALLWFVMGRARSLLVAAAIGGLTTLGILIVAIVVRSLEWGIIAGFGLLFSLAGIQGARALSRMLAAPRREEAACPSCNAAPPIGNFWLCQRCRATFDVFAAAGNCPRCSTPLAVVLCPECGRSRPFSQWSTEAVPLEPVDGDAVPVPTPADLGPPHATGAIRPVTVTQRILWGALFAFIALGLCGLPNSGRQPWGLVIWTAAGAILGAASAGTLTRSRKTSQALNKLRGAWCLVEVDGQSVPDGKAELRRLVLKGLFFEERVGRQLEVRGACWTDPLTEPPAISFTPKIGPDTSKPRQGIYRVEGKQLTVCLAYPGRPRPTAFLSQPDVQQLRVYRRGGKARK